MERIRPLGDVKRATVRTAWTGGPNSRVRQPAQVVCLAYRGYRWIALILWFEVDSECLNTLASPVQNTDNYWMIT